MVADVRTLLVRWGPQHLAKGIERGLEEVDKVVTGLPVQASLIGNLGFAAIGAIGGFMAPAPWDDILLTWGGHHSTTLWDYLETMVTPAAGLRRLAARAGLGASLQQPTGTVGYRPGLGSEIRYAPEQRVITAPKFVPGVLRPKFQLGS